MSGIPLPSNCTANLSIGMQWYQQTVPGGWAIKAKENPITRNSNNADDNDSTQSK